MAGAPRFHRCRIRTLHCAPCPEKHPICQQLGVTHFIDDRLDVLWHLTTVDQRYLFVGGLGDHEPPTQVPEWATVIDTWSRLVGPLTDFG